MSMEMSMALTTSMAMSMEMSNQKKSRTLINIIGVPFLVSLIYLGNFYFSVLIYLAILIGIFEFSRICKGKEIYIQLIPIFIALILIISQNC